VIALRYLDALQELGKGNNKMFVPYEATAALGSIASIRELFGKEPASEAPSASQTLANTIARGPSARVPVPVQERPTSPPSAPRREE
jgi:hypothetical protein